MFPKWRFSRYIFLNSAQKKYLESESVSVRCYPSCSYRNPTFCCDKFSPVPVLRNPLYKPGFWYQLPAEQCAAYPLHEIWRHDFITSVSETVCIFHRFRESVMQALNQAGQTAHLHMSGATRNKGNRSGLFVYNVPLPHMRSCVRGHKLGTVLKSLFFFY